MLRKLYLTAASTVGALLLAQTIYSASLRPNVNAWLVDQQRIVQEEGDKAPLAARMASGFTRLPSALLNGIVSHADAQSVPSQTVENPNLKGHVSVSQTTRPTVAGGTLASGSTDYRGRITAPTQSAPVLTFGSAFASAPWCDVVRTDGQSTVGYSYTVSTTALTFATVTTGAGVSLNYRCDGVMP